MTHSEPLTSPQNKQHMPDPRDPIARLACSPQDPLRRLADDRGSCYRYTLNTRSGPWANSIGWRNAREMKAKGKKRCE
jgi:hypothetical protein